MRGFGDRGGRGFDDRGGRGGGKQDPDDAGKLPPHLLPFSRSLAKVLRHSGAEVGLTIDGDGWCAVKELLGVRELSCFSEHDLKIVVQESFSKSNPRFELQERDDGRWIRATHKRSTLGGGGASRTMSDAPHGFGATGRELTPPPLHTGTPTGTPPRAQGPRSGPPPLPEPLADDPWADGLDPWKAAAVAAAALAAAPAATATATADAPEAWSAPPTATAGDAMPAAVVQAWGGDGAKPSVTPCRYTDIRLQQPAWSAAPAAAAEEAPVASEPAAPASPQEETKEFHMPDNDPEDPADEVDLTAEEALEPCQDEQPPLEAASSNGDIWRRTIQPKEDGGGGRWSCTRTDGSEDFFPEDDGKPWKLYEDPKLGKAYWWNDDTEEYFLVPPGSEGVPGSTLAPL